MTDFAKQLADYRLTTAEILYRLPDHPAVLQSYLWQDLDLAPQFPVLRKFLDFWEREIEGKLYQVRVASAGLIKPAEIRANAALLTLH
ncbi:MAG: usg protein [Alphaproteobacteria bacterium]|nr:usg protein [Alphaproteobacteria bacterium]MCA0449612.1 usg protein [Pseudomonadota bacterium]